MCNAGKMSVMILVSISSICFGVVSNTITVDDDGPADYSSIQAAINASSPGGTILVYEGTYSENINFGGKDITVTSLNPQSQACMNNTVIQGVGGSVVTFSGSESPSCMLTGFTITGGNGTVTGGLKGTTAYGGGVYGGGLNNQTKATISHCNITGNASTYGGGIAHFSGMIKECIINHNTASVSGGGIAYSRLPVVQDSVFKGNVAQCIGINGAGGAVTGCGGLFENCLVVENSARWAGGGLDYMPYLGETYAEIRRCTIANNTAYTGSAIYNFFGTPVTECIIWGNSIANSSPNITFSCVQGGYGGTGNFSIDPRFINGPYGPYYIDENSPCWTAGPDGQPIGYIPEPAGLLILSFGAILGRSVGRKLTNSKQSTAGHR